jgi:imidazolonepropionase-like amidohydrolase
MTPLAALQSATINPAKFLAGGESKLNAKDFSVIGNIANLVLLRSDPLADIRNTTQIQAVWLRGEYFDQAALAQLLETAKQAAKH